MRHFAHPAELCTVSRALGIALALAATTGGLLSGCAEGPESEAVRFVAPDGSYELSYVAPPWQVSAREGPSLELEIASELFGVAFEESPPTHLLVAGPVDLTRGFDDIVGAESGEPDDLDTDGFDTEGFDPDGFDPDGFDPDGFDPDGFDPDGFDPGELDPGLPEYLLEVDLDDPRAVAFAELQYLVDDQGARIHRGIGYVRTGGGLEGLAFQVVVDPGVFVRAFYFPTRGRTLRIGIVSLFDLETADIDAMMATVRTDLEMGGRVP